MDKILTILTPEIILVVAACALFLLGCSKNLAVKRAIPMLALAALLAALLYTSMNRPRPLEYDRVTFSLHLDTFAWYVRFLACGVAVMLLLLSWPTDEAATGNSALNFGADAGEYFALFLVSVMGLLLTAVSNDLILLFLGLELVSIPTYIMVSISRPLPVAQEAGVKYFFLGALSVALMLFGFSYLFGATGEINLTGMSNVLAAKAQAGLSRWEMLGVALVLIGFAFKMAAFPLHYYAGDVYEGAATPVTAFLAFTPKAAGFVATIKLLYVLGGDNFILPNTVSTLLWFIAALTMTAGNVLGLLQSNVKRVLAYSSVAHSGYMLVGLASLGGTANAGDALMGVLFYLAAYGIMNAGAFGVLMLLPAKDGRGAAETFEDLAGAGRRHPGLGLAMAVSCFSLIGIPLTVGFIGKLMLIKPALAADHLWLVIILVVNAAISAAYYLRIVATMFLRSGPAAPVSQPATSDLIAEPVAQPQVSILTAVLLSVILTLMLGIWPTATNRLAETARNAADLQPGRYQPAVATPVAEAPVAAR